MIGVFDLMRRYPLSFQGYWLIQMDSFEHVLQECPGWVPLMVEACEQIEAHLLKMQRLVPDSRMPSIVQIKEKMGTLRIDMIPSDDYLSQIRLHALEQSGGICAACGSLLKWRGRHEPSCGLSSEGHGA